MSVFQNLIQKTNFTGNSQRFPQKCHRLKAKGKEDKIEKLEEVNDKALRKLFCLATKES